MTKSELLILKVKQTFNIEIENVRRTYAGRNMKACGANTWISNIKGSSFEIGSQKSITEILKAKNIKLVPGWTTGSQEIEISN